MKHILIQDAVALRNIIDFARQNGCEAELGKSMLRLLSYLTSGMVKDGADGTPLVESEGDHVGVISADFAPYSLRFFATRGSAFRPDDWTRGPGFHNGGFIYEGPGQPHDGSAPALTVSLSSNPSKHSWSVHT